ncbi:hypothetical protein ABIE44_003159 [Marmoricola sp. OAE513]|uniref:peptidyl-prolyl cis-trans isomerase n=1 Tax=Marmoricola sp. OAE513 TaxID=2817894 RepID=UPI001AE3DA78
MTGVSLPDAPASLAARRVFAADGVVFTVSDLARRARPGGREALFGSPVEAEEGFRRSRGLLTADRLDAWLATWEIDPDDFRRWCADACAGTTTASPWCAFVCSGDLEATSAELLSAAAAACALGAGPVDAATFEPDGWVERLATTRTTDAAVGAVVAAHRLDWTRLVAHVVETTSRAVAEELRHQVLHDGLPLADAAAAAALPVRQVDDVLSRIGAPAVRAALAGALPGELLGPVPAGDGWCLLHVVSRTDPSPEEPGSRARAEAVVRAEVISGAVARHVVA